jgi:AraC-like DNA-binding protein
MGSRLDYIKDWESEATRARYRVAELAAHCGVTQRQLRRYFWEKFGVSPHLWMARQRAAWIKARLSHGALIKEIAAEAGFSRQENFSRYFKKHHNVTPTQARSK